MKNILRDVWLIVIVAVIALLISLPLFHPVMRYRINRFSWASHFLGYDGKPPHYRGKQRVNKYLQRLRFKSTIPLEEWRKKKPQLEVLFKRKIFDIKEGKTVRKTEILLIQEQLPKFILWDDCKMVEGRNFAIGEGLSGPIIWRVKNLPHGLISGASGGGKTTILRLIVHQATLKRWNVSVLDLKGGGDFYDVKQESEKYHDLGTEYGPFLVSDPEEARQLLLALVIEAKGRLDKFREAGVKDIDEYNASGKGFLFVPWLVVIDEAAELLDIKPADKAEKERYMEINQSLRTLARMSRAAGITLLLGFIRPSSDVLDGQIKNNLLFRCCGFFSDPAVSRIVLDNDRATELPPEIKGRFIIGEDEVQAYYLPTISPEDRGGK